MVADPVKIHFDGSRLQVLLFFSVAGSARSGAVVCLVGSRWLGVAKFFLQGDMEREWHWCTAAANFAAPWCLAAVMVEFSLAKGASNLSKVVGPPVFVSMHLSTEVLKRTVFFSKFALL